MAQFISFAERRRSQPPDPSTFLKGIKLARNIGGWAGGGTGIVGSMPYAAPTMGGGIGGGGVAGGLSGAPGAAGFGGGVGGSGAGQAAQSVIGKAAGTSTLGYLAGPAVGFGLGRATQSRGIGIGGGFLVGLATGGPIGAIAGAIAGIIGGAHKDSAPPTYENYKAFWEGKGARPYSAMGYTQPQAEFEQGLEARQAQPLMEKKDYNAWRDTAIKAMG